MKIAITGCNGSVGKPVVACALQHGHDVVGLDITSSAATEPALSFTQVDLTKFDDTLNALRGCDAVIQLAGIPQPKDYKAFVHNANVVISWNVLRACADLGITRIAQASSVNVYRGVFSASPHFDYFPIDESHPCEPDEPYGLSKVICELQADSIVRRYPHIRIASLRLHWSVPHREKAIRLDNARSKGDLWGYVQEDSAAQAFLLAVADHSHSQAMPDQKWAGHETFLIVSPVTSAKEDSGVLKETYWPHVPVRGGGEICGKVGFYNCEKARTLLGWEHRDGVDGGLNGCS
ncbi:NAD(P)-binding protein [Pluteus cervinus]|uniref:NAD(P)-binding protein n=1 Tax=Pluteus cervinus TaxID=181527 RepID=A0ACD3BBW5_9AGAR|nr:NAD(P)-binding protein [Pluteus cervinus]